MKKRIHLTTFLVASAFAAAPAAIAQYAQPDGHLAQAANEKGAFTTKNVVDDREIMLRVQAALGKDKDLSALSLSIKVTGGNVLLTGVARSQAQVARAAEIVRAVPGVKSVNSEVRVS